MERSYWLAWSELRGIGPVLLKRIQQHFGSLAAAWNAPDREFLMIEGLGARTVAQFIAQRASLEPEALLEQHQQKNPGIWVPSDTEYPRLLWEIPDPPPVLYWHGNLRSWAESCTIGIVGTRNPSSYGVRWTEKVTQALVERGFVIVSGLAEGIDTVAHQTCVKAGGQAIAVVGTGVDRVYPPRNQKLYSAILENGLVLSEYPQGTPPDRSHFPRRNRIIAGLSRAILVMEAPEGSGALITAYQANEYHRDVYALPGNLDTKQSKGCLQLIQRGAQLILGIDELLECLGAMPLLDQEASTVSPPMIELSPLQNQLLQSISPDQPIAFDRIIQTCEAGPGEVASTLLELELLGVVEQHPGMRYQRVSP